MDNKSMFIAPISTLFTGRLIVSWVGQPTMWGRLIVSWVGQPTVWGTIDCVLGRLTNCVGDD